MATYVKIRLVRVVCVAAIVLGGASAYADFTFSKPVELGPPIWYPGDDPQGCCFSRDGLQLYFSTNWSGGQGGAFDLWVATRETVDAPWTEPVNLGPNVNSSAAESDPAISPDGLELYFTLFYESPHQIRRCTRPSQDAPWSKPEVVFPSASVGGLETAIPEVSADGLSLYMMFGTPDYWDIAVSTRATTEDDWGTPVKLGPNVNSSPYEGYPSISSDGLALFFNSTRPGGKDNWDIWVTTRPTTDAEWGPPVYYPSFNQALELFSPAISPDGSVLYFENAHTMWQSFITPVVDFTGDYRVDIEDLVLLIEHWGQNDPAYDMGPMPWGDGIVDSADLEVLMKYWGQELYDPHLLAHWKLDETEGDVAYDSAAENDAVIVGDALWQPEGGQIDGALQFDGLDDYIDTQFRFDPSKGPFSAFAWVKGGAPGQVIMSQMQGMDWLVTDAAQGVLRTDLTSELRGKRGPSLMSQGVTITDGHWHRVGLVWNGDSRILYVDDSEVARDTMSSLMSSRGDLIIGAGTDLAGGTNWSGLIDDIRIYDRVVAP